MKRKTTNLFLAILFLLVVSVVNLNCQQVKTDAKKRLMRALILDGQNNHEIWPKTTMMIKSYLEQTGIFTVDIARTKYTWQNDPYDQDGGVTRNRRLKIINSYPVPGGKITVPVDTPVTDKDYKPDFSSYDVVLSNFGWKVAPWPLETQKALERYVKNGGGFMIIHAADNSFLPGWLEYMNMAGIGGWGFRQKIEKYGARLYYTQDGVLVRDTSAEVCGSHGHEHEFLITLRDTINPVTKGMPVKWMHAKDEMYDRLRGPAEDITVLATAYSDYEENASFWTPLKGTNHNEPMVLCRNYGKGRVFHTTLGHWDYSMECVGFIVLIQRGAEWAATGKVTQAIPADFPTADKVSVRKWDLITNK